MAAEEFEYRGYSLGLEPFGAGWRVTIRKIGAQFIHEAIPHSYKKEDREVVLRQAEAVVDAELARKA